MNLFFFLVFASLLIKNSLPIPAPLQTKTYLRRQHGLPAALTSHYLYMFPPQWPVCHQKSSRRFVCIPNFLSSKSSTFSIPVFVAVSIPGSESGIHSLPAGIPDSRGSQTPVFGRLGFRQYRCCCRTDILLFFSGSQDPSLLSSEVWDSFPACWDPRVPWI